MTPWTALNIEPESDEEDLEYDNTKEIQIEEALKLYQVALKLHSQGPDFYEATEQAYDALFESEVFQYSESKTELERLAALNSNEEFEDEGIVLSPEVSTGEDLAPSTLPQILYLSFKNKGQFLLDRIGHDTRGHCSTPTSIAIQSQDRMIDALHLFSEALDKEDSDPDLWRRIAKLSEHIGSRRIARFALESSITDEDQNEIPLLDGCDPEELAVQHDLEIILSSIECENRTLVPAEYRALAISLAESFEFLNNLPGQQPDMASSTMPANQIRVLEVSTRSWEHIAEVILETYETELEEHTDTFDIYILRLLYVDQETLEALKSPILVTSDSLSKRCFSKSPVTLFKPVPKEFNMRNQTSPMIRTKNLDGLLMDSQHDVDTINDTSLITSGRNTTTVVPQSEPRPTNNKRNSESAGLPDTPDGGGRVRSKRLRARAETIADDLPDQKAINKQHEEQFGVYSRADDWMFTIANEIGGRFGCMCIGNAETIRDAVSAGAEGSIEASAISNSNVAPLRDFRQVLGNWNANRSNLLLNGAGNGASAVLIDDGSDSGFANFMERSNTDSRQFENPLAELVDQGVSQWFQGLGDHAYDLGQIALVWLRALLEPQEGGRSKLKSMYTQYVWSSGLRDNLTEVLTKFDEVIYAFAIDRETETSGGESNEPIKTAARTGLVETVFELHVDIYSKMMAPDSKSDQPSRVAQRDKVARWESLASRTVGAFGQESDRIYSTCYVLRHLWAQVAYIALVEASARDHILLCYQDLRQLFEREGSPKISLPNNSTMAEVSLEALEQEMSKEKTMDFFQGVFGSESKDPITLIEKLEPVLMQTFNSSRKPLGEQQTEDGSGKERSRDERNATSPQSTSPVITVPKGDHGSVENTQLVHFLQKATIQLKLSLWHQLNGAYNRIDYPGMKVVCNFRSMIIILRELHGSSYAEEIPEDRAGNLIIWLRNLADLVSQTLDTIKSHVKALDCLAEENLELALEACALIVRLFHVFALWEDSIRIGQTSLPLVPGNSNAYKNAMTFLREMQPKAWYMLYLIYREAFSQDSSLKAAGSEDLTELVRAIHCTFGNREYCRVGRKNLIKLMRSELIRLKGPEEEIAQALYDLYGLKITSNPNSVWEHGCTGDSIDRTSTLEIVEYVTTQASNMNMKDLLKSDVRIAIEKMQAVIGIPRAGPSTTQQSFNRRLVTNYLKSPVTSNQLTRALHGLVGLSTMMIRTEYATIASKKWFFLVGYIHLSKYRNNKRIGPDVSDDLDDAIIFLKLDLDFDASGWETWMRLGQAYDSKLDEAVLWDANIINEKPNELTQHERNAIHCYEIAVSLARQSADDTRETQLKLSELYADFANRLYSSTREPFNARVLDLTGYERYVNQQERGTFQVPAYESLSLTTIWKTCERLYQKALDEKLEDDWFIWYMRGKCRWKLLREADDTTLDWKYPIRAFVKAVEQVPEKRDSRHPEKEPVLEPHFKLLSVVYKLLEKGTISVSYPHAKRTPSITVYRPRKVLRFCNIRSTARRYRWMKHRTGGDIHWNFYRS